MRWVDGHGGLTPEAETAAADLVELIAQAAPGVNGLYDVLCEGTDREVQSSALRLHLAAGGQRPMRPTDDAAMAALADLAAEAFTLLLLADPAMDEQKAMLAQLEAAAMAMHPNARVTMDPRLPDTPFIEGRLLRFVLKRAAGSVALAALTADPDIQALFDRGTPTPVPTVMWASSLGHVQTVQLPSLPVMLLTDGYRRLRALNRAHTVQAYVDEVAAGLDLVRQVARGGAADVPAIVALRGGQVDPACPVSTPYGTVRAMSGHHAELGPPNIKASAVLETVVRIHVGLGDDLETTNPPADAAPVWATLRERGAMVGEAAMLATGSPLVMAWQTVLDPFAFSLFPTPEPLAFAPPLGLPDLSPGLAAWAERIVQDTDHGVALARTRLVSAMLRPSSEDALIDAVVALEALFGDAEGELTFRIATAIAWLLGVDGPDRRKLFKEARDLYAYRSRIVHGGKPPKDMNARDAAMAAVALAWKSLRAVHERGGRLLTDKQARTIGLLLDADDDVQHEVAL